MSAYTNCPLCGDDSLDVDTHCCDCGYSASDTLRQPKCPNCGDRERYYYLKSSGRCAACDFHWGIGQCILIETHDENGVEWGVSRTSHNPESKDYFACKSKEDAIRACGWIGASEVPAVRDRRVEYNRSAF